MILSSVVLVIGQRLKIVDILARDIIIPSLIFGELCHRYKGGPSNIISIFIGWIGEGT